MFSLMSVKSKRSSYSRVGAYDSVSIRMARPEDEYAIYRVAALDGAKAPAGRVLVAEADGDIIAALSVTDGAKAADPFRWTSDVIALMKMRADQLSADDARPARSASRAVKQLRTQLT